MRLPVRIVVHSLLTWCVALPVLAQDKFDVVEARIRSLAPNASSIAVAETPINGLLQVQVGGDIVYVSDDGKYLIQGKIVDLDTRDDLTEAAKSAMRKEILKQVDPTQQIRFAPENPVYELTVFTDIDCGYCRKLHSQIEGYEELGIAVNYMAFPRAGLGSESYEKYVSVWCADDQQTALTSAKAGNDPEPLNCENPVAEQYNLGIALGVSGTPSLLTPEGKMFPGYVPPEALKERLDSLYGNAEEE